MTNPSVPPAVRGLLGSPRTLAAWALVGYAALHLAFTFLVWAAPGSGSVSGGARGAHYEFTNPLIMAMPVVAVVIATYITPVAAGAKLMALVALIEYAVSLAFGGLTFLIGLGAAFDGVGTAEGAMAALQYLVMGIATLVLLVVAGYVVFRAFTALGGRLPVGRGSVTPPPPPATP
jgi:hypothetical protein